MNKTAIIIISVVGVLGLAAVFVFWKYTKGMVDAKNREIEAGAINSGGAGNASIHDSLVAALGLLGASGLLDKKDKPAALPVMTDQQAYEKGLKIGEYQTPATNTQPKNGFGDGVKNVLSIFG